MRHSPDQLNLQSPVAVSRHWHEKNSATLLLGDCRDLLAELPDASVQLVVTSPPYNIGKTYERRHHLSDYLREQREIIHACIDKLRSGGSICWQVGNHVDSGEVFPLDVLLYPYFKERDLRLRNRIVWHFEHGLHCSQRLSGRHETILWFTKDAASGEYVFNLDPIRVPQKYPGKKHFKGAKKGQPSANPLGKNPGDVWKVEDGDNPGDVWVIPNVKHNHIEKTVHPCQFPIELVERLVLALTDPGDLVLDPYMGVGSSIAAAVLHGRRGAGADIVEEYVRIAGERVNLAATGSLQTRPRQRPIYEPSENSALTQRPWDSPNAR
ncbi:MAG: DNA-methyltransferase [Gemmatimonadaceae bacterium]